MAEHPMQPLESDEDGRTRFKRNALVCYLLDNGGIDLNKLATLDFSQDDRQHFAQLIGYSLKGFHELRYVSDDQALRASQAARKAGLPADGCRDSGCPIHCGVEESPDAG